MNQIHFLDISFMYNGSAQVITPVLLQDEHEMILVDCGYPDFLPLLQEAAYKQHLNLGALTKVIVTHHDMDHIGSLAALKRAYPHLEIIAYESEAPYIAGKKTSLRLQQAQSTLDQLSADEKQQAEQFIHFLQSIEPIAVDRTVTNHEHLPWCGGIEIVHTPGHMPGHISLYVTASKMLIAGDAVVIENGRLEIANPAYTLDMQEATRSIRNLLEYDIEQLICYHGGVFQGDIKQALRELIQAYDQI
ncbi:MBL fold metallo-hydrolase [Brevibacillus fortis]|uniref:MBL fold metallo-hydrolase n=1 Tax=Brevibacillus fortis TaxID=2126352 RepID=A0A2P7V5Q9_9BACL|nr:MBL fold metallo-hydrolase [Brevibacillus fortis]MED1780470.1 MBL fold metallo-hydrolase [Brevibacillus fortis]PSJ94551.1 MBL fold metallo-hydrolase [Brevibacillus fortis]